MKILITGASGYLGNILAHQLAVQGHEIHALVRSAKAAANLQHPNIRIYTGNILDKTSLALAMKGCTQVYHTAARVGAWSKDPTEFYRVNIDGTRNVLDAALAFGVSKTVATSSCGILGPGDGTPLEENSVRQAGFDIDYDLSKKKSEDLVLHYAAEGMNVVVVSPSKVYGPGSSSHSLTANAVIKTFLEKKFAIIPAPGTNQVCFAFVNDVVAGHQLAMEKGKAGENYILGGHNISYKDFFSTIREISGCRGHIIPLAKWVVRSWAHLQEIKHSVAGSNIRFTVKSVNHLFDNYTFSSKKAEAELGYNITPIEEALEQTIRFLKIKL